MTIEQKLERLLDRIADELILSEYVSTADVKKNQKFIRNGQIQFGDLDDGNNLALYQKDREANTEDLGDELRTIASTIVDFDTLVVSVSGGTNNTITVSLMGGGLPDTGQEISNLLFQQTEDGVIINPLNVTQFIPLEQSGSVVDLNTANEFLDTNIYELLPTSDTRQARIIRFFQELNALLPPEAPEFSTPVTRDEEGNWVGSQAYSSDNSISYAQDNPSLSSIDEEDAFIHRIKGGSVPANSTNSTRTIEDIYNTIEPYLKDI